jgi:transposase
LEERHIEPEEPPKREVKQEERGHERPPEPLEPPRNHRDHQDKKKKKKKKSGKKRGGGKHQRHYRENTHPVRKSHRRFPQEYLRHAGSFTEGISRRV